MSVTSGLAKLKQSGKDLRRHWGDVCAYWRDENRRQFEERRIAPLLQRLRAAEMNMAHMASVLDRVRRDCE